MVIRQNSGKRGTKLLPNPMFSRKSPKLRVSLKNGVYLYLSILALSSCYLFFQLWLDKQHVDSYYAGIATTYREKRKSAAAAAAATIETFDIMKGIKAGIEKPIKALGDKMKKPMTSVMGGITSMITFFKTLVKQLKSLKPRITYIGIGLQNARKGIISSNASIETGVIGGFEWFKRHVKWIERMDCYPLYFLSCVYTFVTSPVYLFFKALEYLFLFTTGVDFAVDTYIANVGAFFGSIASDLGLSYPAYITNCYKCDGCLPQEEIDKHMKIIAPRNFKNAKTYFRRADCAFQHAVA